MLIHMSLPARDPERVANVLAELLGATVVVAPSPPFPAGARYVCSFDERGSLVEILPAGAVYARGPDASPHAEVGPAPAAAPSSVHGLFLTRVAIADLERIAAREGWPCGRVKAGPFQLLAVWMEGTQLVELVTPELLGDYIALYGPAGRVSLDPTLRAIEARLRGANDATA